ncbi:MAG: hypothetical protein U0670_02240 [Anaerolineae bacterium]
MNKYTVFSSDHEILGFMILSYQFAIDRDDFLGFYEEEGLNQVQPDKWYPAQKVLNVFNALAERGGEMTDFVSIGMAVSMQVPLPPETKKLPPEAVLMGILSAAKDVNRGSNVGYDCCYQDGPGHLRYELCSPMPDDVFYGLIYGMARRLLPEGTPFTVTYDSHLPRREDGGSHTVIHLKW